MIAVLGGLADVECDLIRTRTAEGRSRAKARGQHMGRPSKLTDAQKAEARRRRAEGATLAELARSYGVGLSTISRLTAWRKTTFQFGVTMTLVAALKIEGIPALIGDFLITDEARHWASMAPDQTESERSSIKAELLAQFSGHPMTFGAGAAGRGGVLNGPGARALSILRSSRRSLCAPVTFSR
jgi:transcriptional regulator with XRE-family HTH domain